MLIDTHAHLNIEPIYTEWEQVLAEAKWAGVEKVIVPGSSIETSRLGVTIANKAEGVYAAVGIHPEEIGEMTIDDELRLMIQELEQMAISERVVAIGECGLDYHYAKNNADQQKKLFQLQIDLAKKLDLPLIIHSREPQAIEDVAKMVGDYQRCVYHCFSGETDPGVFVGIGGTITYKKNDDLRGVVRQIPLERIILETDAPWLSPEPRRGRTNSPANVTIVALKLAELKQVPVSQIIEQTSKNACQLFGI
jgi:TatD DNase family protein